jgi:N-carbamoyl-L-amino-acid hydrolase
MAKEFVAAGEKAAGKEDATFGFAELWRAPRVTFDPALRDALQAAAEAAGVPTMPLFSAAGHDAVHLARLAPSAMLFVPSIGGVSHHPEEHTPMEALVAGARVLAQAIARFAGGEVS